MFPVEFFLYGALGALVKDIVRDGCLQMPYFRDTKMFLGFLGSVVVGGSVGIIVDTNYIVSFMGGYTGYSIIEEILNRIQISKEIKEGSFK